MLELVLHVCVCVLTGISKPQYAELTTGPGRTILPDGINEILLQRNQSVSSAVQSFSHDLPLI